MLGHDNILIGGTSWDHYFIKLAELVSTKSKDPSTKVGVVIVGAGNEILTTGFNGFPRKIDESVDTRWERPVKYDWIVHAEANAIANAARTGVKLEGSRLYMNFLPSPCTGCTGLLIQAGIQSITGPDRSFSGKGKGVHYDVEDVAETLIREADIYRYTIKNED